MANEAELKIDREYRNRRIRVMVAITLGYSFYYVCRLGLSVAKKPLIDCGILNAEELGNIGSAIFLGYAFGKFINGFMADHVDVRKLFIGGLFFSCLCNLLMGFSSNLWLFVLAWGLNGWFQSFGAVSCAISLSNWFTYDERGKFYSLWSASHSVGEGLTFVGSAALVSWLGWRGGFLGPAFFGVLVTICLLWLMCSRPGVYGLPIAAEWKGKGEKKKPVDMVEKPGLKATLFEQLSVIKMPVVWMISFASAGMYITRYAVNSWAILYLQEIKGLSIMEAGGLLGINTGAGIIGGLVYGFCSDVFFKGRRPPASLMYAIIELVSLLIIFVLPSSSYWVLSVTFALFGFSIGGLLIGLGGLFAIDVVSKKLPVRWWALWGCSAI